MFGFWDEIADLERRMDDIVRRLVGPRAHLAYPALPLFVHKPFFPPVDIFTKEEDLVVRIELPGIDPESDLRVLIERDELVVRGERRKQEEREDETYYRMEAGYGAFERRIPIPEGVDASSVSAEYVDGVLTVILPKVARAQRPPEAKEIPIRTNRPMKAA